MFSGHPKWHRRDADDAKKALWARVTNGKPDHPEAPAKAWYYSTHLHDARDLSGERIALLRVLMWNGPVNPIMGVHWSVEPVEQSPGIQLLCVTSPARLIPYFELGGLAFALFEAETSAGSRVNFANVPPTGRPRPRVPAMAMDSAGAIGGFVNPLDAPHAHAIASSRERPPGRSEPPVHGAKVVVIEQVKGPGTAVPRDSRADAPDPPTEQVPRLVRGQPPVRTPRPPPAPPVQRARISPRLIGWLFLAIVASAALLALATVV